MDQRRGGAGVIASPVLSADGATVYVNGRDQRLWALHAADGKPKWSVPLGFLAQTPPAVTPAGTDRVRRRPRHPAGRVQGRRRPRRRGVAPRRRRRRCRRRAWPARASATPWSAGRPRTARRACRCWSSTRPTGHTAEQLSAAGGHRLARRGVGRQRPAGGRRDQRRSGVRLRAGLKRLGRIIALSSGRQTAAAGSRCTRTSAWPAGDCRQNLAVAEEEDQLVVGDREVLVMRRVQCPLEVQDRRAWPDSGAPAPCCTIGKITVQRRRCPGRNRVSKVIGWLRPEVVVERLVPGRAGAPRRHPGRS